jgi:hypothetical protein
VLEECCRLSVELTEHPDDSSLRRKLEEAWLKLTPEEREQWADFNVRRFHPAFNSGGER